MNTFIRLRLRKISLVSSAAISILALALNLFIPPLSYASTAGYSASDVLGQITNGQPDFTTSTATSTQTGLNYPSGSELDTTHHRLFVNDYGNNRVLVYALDTNNNLTSHAPVHVLGQTNFTNNGYATTQSTLRGVYGSVIYDNANNRLFVNDSSNNRILVFDLSNGITDGMPASYVIGQSDFISRTSAATQTNFINPYYMAYDIAHQQLFVSDKPSSRVLVFNVAPNLISNGMPAAHVLGKASYTTTTHATTQSDMWSPEGLAYNNVTHHLYVGDTGNSRILDFNLSNGVSDDMLASNVLGQTGFTTKVYSSTPTQTAVSDASGLGIDTTRNILYMADDDYNRVLAFNLSDGISNNMPATMVIGQVSFTSEDFNCVPSAVSLCDVETSIPVDIANNQIWLADSDNNRVLTFTFARLNAIPAATLNQSYSQALGAQTQGTPTYSVSGGTLPAGLSLNSATGVLSGTPTSLGTSTFTITLVDDNGAIGSFTDNRAYTFVTSAATTPSSSSSPTPTSLLTSSTIAALPVSSVTPTVANSSVTVATPSAGTTPTDSNPGTSTDSSPTTNSLQDGATAASTGGSIAVTQNNTPVIVTAGVIVVAGGVIFWLARSRRHKE